MDDLISVLLDRGKDQEAEMMGRSVLKARESILGPVSRYLGDHRRPGIGASQPRKVSRGGEDVSTGVRRKRESTRPSIQIP